MSRTREAIKKIEPGWIDGIVMTLGRPWVFALAFAFLLTPSRLLVAALNSGAAFLKIGTGARPTAMGGAYTALADDVDALYYNPGGLANLKKRELGMTHAQWLLGTTFDYIGYAHPTKGGTFGLGVTRLAAGGQEGRGADRRVAGGFEASDTAYAIGYSRNVGTPGFLGLGKTSAGGSMKYLQSRIGSYTASTVGFDLGAQHKLAGRPLTLGVSVLNLGRGMRYLEQTDPLPLAFSFGGAYRFPGLMQVALDVRREVHDGRMDIGLGTEYALHPGFTLRAGYASQVAHAASRGPADALGGLGGGFGLKFGNYRADYTFTPFGQLGNAQRISLGTRF